MGGQYQADPKSTGLLEHAQHHGLGSRVGNRGQVAHDLIKIDQRAQHTGTLLQAHPTFYGGKKQSDEEHAFIFTQVSQVEDGMARLAAGGIQDRLNIQRLAALPDLEGGGS
ncbi:hypothetical protein SDC9_145973 [bioreactor metagenome]|uniref:Uncharacterized protein n=1 Tax=bioreactor metagenome TaxID=1076179 RepID=A0A645EDG0_9ZZZZ